MITDQQTRRLLKLAQSEAQLVSIAAVSPGIFTVNQQGTGQRAVPIANTATLAAPTGTIPGREARLANRLEFISIFCTGLGEVTNRPPSGEPATGDGLYTTLQTARVTIGGVEVPVSFSGLTAAPWDFIKWMCRYPRRGPSAMLLTSPLPSAGSHRIPLASPSNSGGPVPRFEDGRQRTGRWRLGHQCPVGFPSGEMKLVAQHRSVWQESILQFPSRCVPFAGAWRVRFQVPRPGCNSPNRACRLRPENGYGVAP